MKEQVLEGLECPLCFLSFDEENHIPKAFPCFHTFCGACLLQLFQKGRTADNDLSRIPCPVCNTVYSLRSCDEFRKNYAVADLVRILNQKRPVEEPDTDPDEWSAVCAICDAEDSTPAESYCGACNFLLCGPHAQIHKSGRRTSSHVLVAASSVPASERTRVLGAGDAAKKVFFCARHEGEKLRYYCQDCDDLLCLDCYNLTHKQHVVDEIDEELADDRKARLNTLREMLLATFSGSSVKCPTFDVTHCLGVIDAAATAAIQQIHSQKATIKGLIRQETCVPKAGRNVQKHWDHMRASAESLCAYWLKTRDRMAPTEVLLAFPGLLGQMEQLLGQPPTARVGRPMVSLVVPALQPFAHITTPWDNKVERRLTPVSTSVSLPAGKGDCVAFTYDSYRDVVWVATSHRWVGGYLVGRRAWTGEWFLLETPVSAAGGASGTSSPAATPVSPYLGRESAAPPPIHSLAMMPDGLCFIIPQSRDTVEVYDRRGRKRPIRVPLFESSSSSRVPRGMLSGLSCCGDDLIVSCESGFAFVVRNGATSTEAAPSREVSSVCLPPGAGSGTAGRAHMREECTSLLFALVGEASTDIVSAPLTSVAGSSCDEIAQSSAPSSAPSDVHSGVGPEVLRSLPGKHSGAVAWDDESAVAWSTDTLSLFFDGHVARIDTPLPILDAVGNTRREVFVLFQRGMVVLEDTTLTLPPVTSPIPCPRTLIQPGRTVQSLAYDAEGSLWVLTDAGDVIEYSSSRDLAVERFCCESRAPQASKSCALPPTPYSLVCFAETTEKANAAAVYATCDITVVRYSVAKHSLSLEPVCIPKGSRAASFSPARGVGVWVQDGEDGIVHIGESSCHVGSRVTSVSVSAGGVWVLAGTLGGGAVLRAHPDDPAVETRFKLPCADPVVDMALHGEHTVVAATAGGVVWLVGLGGDDGALVLGHSPVALPDLSCLAVYSLHEDADDRRDDSAQGNDRRVDQQGSSERKTFEDGMLAVGDGRHVRFFRLSDWLKHDPTFDAGNISAQEHSKACGKSECVKKEVDKPLMEEHSKACDKSGDNKSMYDRNVRDKRWYNKRDSKKSKNIFLKQHSKSCNKSGCKKREFASFDDLCSAAGEGLLNCVKFISISTEGKLTRRENKNGDTVLHWAACNGHADVIRYLVKEGGAADLVNKTGKCADTVLHVASYAGHVAVIRCFVEEVGARQLISETDKNGHTVLHWAARGGHVDVMRYFLEECGATDLIGVTDDNGCTVLHAAAKYGQVDVIRYFVEERGSKDLLRELNNDGETALDVAKRYGKRRVVEGLANDAGEDP